MRPGPHVPGCLHGTPGEVRHECTCSEILERRRLALERAWFVSAAAYTGPSALRTELAGLLRNVAKTEQRLESMMHYEYNTRSHELHDAQARRQRRIDEIKAKLDKHSAVL